MSSTPPHLVCAQLRGNDFTRLLGGMRPKTEHDKPMFISLVDRTVGFNIHRIAVNHGHSIPFDHFERSNADSSSCPKSLVHGAKECNATSSVS